ncbi:hypothetical protein RAK27_18540 [Carnobacterium maltaromaticum]|uniref:Uncharacterized protein n=1 Tax=Carnobacterium maltaromaticum TaxID=2751 RepID=A0AAW9JYL4_CARML|nr:hypothetical protein [Carnobacterium maltaromaticum]MDZ5760643.1 hypothetical protein [Carnobacterium maltaromaticum]
MEKNKLIAKNLSSHKQIVSNTMIYEGHSYLNLENSFKKNWDKHIQSLKKFKGEQKVGIFLIEYLDHMALSMAELSLNGVNEICIGDIKRQEMVNDYRLSRDKDMLDWISTFEKEIEYVVFMSQEHVEIIKLSGISKLQTVLPYKYAIAPNITQRTDRWVQIGKISNKDE